MFRTQAIILQKNIIHPKKTRVILFTREYGKLHVWYRRMPHEIGDTGAILNVGIDRRDGINFLSHTSVHATLIPLEHTYNELILLLELIRVMSLILPDGMAQEQIFDDYGEIYSRIDDAECLKKNITIFLFRLLKMTGVLNPEPFRNQSPLNAIYTHIDRVHIRTILASEKLSHDQLDDMKRYAFSSLASYIA